MKLLSRCAVGAMLISIQLFAAGRSLSEAFSIQYYPNLMISNPSDVTQHVTVTVKDFGGGYISSNCHSTTAFLIGGLPSGSWTCGVTNHSVKAISQQASIDPSQTLIVTVCGSTPTSGACNVDTGPVYNAGALGGLTPGGGITNAIVTIDVVETTGYLTAYRNTGTTPQLETPFHGGHAF